ncbi:MAG: hypothetical protein SGI71_13780 [Verrucomicrobiota bacterium]|nr:hypothetical protein [Verrucomicrobiota bacterium]
MNHDLLQKLVHDRGMPKDSLDAIQLARKSLEREGLSIEDEKAVEVACQALDERAPQWADNSFIRRFFTRKFNNLVRFGYTHEGVELLFKEYFLCRMGIV